MKKKVLTVVVCLILLAVAGLGGYLWMTAHNENGNEYYDEVYNKSVEELINEDKAYFDNMAGEITFYESRVVMPQAFNVSDKFVAQSVINVFQQKVQTQGDGFETTVYMFSHQLNDACTDVDIHKGAFVLDDKPIDMDSIDISFDEAFTLARQSNYAPSRSRYITLRHAIGSKECNPFYTIGNETYGHLWVDAVSGVVTDKAPNVK